MKENKSIQERPSFSRRQPFIITPTVLHADRGASLRQSNCRDRQVHHFQNPFGQCADYTLSKGLGFWELTFAGQCAIFKHEQGAFYVAHLLLHPWAEPIHGLALALEIRAIYGKTGGVCEIADPTSGRRVRVTNGATLQQRSLGLDDAEAARNLHRKRQELEALLEAEDQIEPVKAEVQRELEAIYQFQNRHAMRIRTSAEKAADAVGKAIKRLYRHLATSLDAQGNPHPVLSPFAQHLKQYLLLPSGRCGGPGGLRAGESFGGCFVYRAPEGVVWRGETEHGTRKTENVKRKT